VEVNLNGVWWVPQIKLQPLGSQWELQFPPLLQLWLPWPTEYAVLLPEWQEQEPGRCPPLPSQDNLLPLGVVVWQIRQQLIKQMKPSLRMLMMWATSCIATMQQSKGEYDDKLDTIDNIFDGSLSTL
jgi:hypothetical protein